MMLPLQARKRLGVDNVYVLPEGAYRRRQRLMRQVKFASAVLAIATALVCFGWKLCRVFG